MGGARRVPTSSGDGRRSAIAPSAAAPARTANERTEGRPRWTAAGHCSASWGCGTWPPCSCERAEGAIPERRPPPQLVGVRRGAVRAVDHSLPSVRSVASPSKIAAADGETPPCVPSPDRTRPYLIGRDDPGHLSRCEACAGTGSVARPGALPFGDLRARVIALERERGIDPTVAALATGQAACYDNAELACNIALRNELSGDQFSLSSRSTRGRPTVSSSRCWHLAFHPGGACRASASTISAAPTPP